MDQTSLRRVVFDWWKQGIAQDGLLRTSRRFLALAYEFLRDSTPERRRQRYGDVDYDWDRRVDTTAATVGWRERLMGMFLSPYQATDPALFREMMSSLNIDFHEFTFVDIGSGKGRVLLMAWEYPFRRIIGIEIMPELHRIAVANIAKFQGSSQAWLPLESVCADARDFQFPPGPLVIYFFNPLPEAALDQVVRNLEADLGEYPRPVYVIYHNPLLEHVLARSQMLLKRSAAAGYCVYATIPRM